MNDGYRAHRGFTLLELIIALIILAVISLGIGSYLRLGADSYVSTIDRERLQSEARFVMERLTREIRHAAPNSVFKEEVEGNQCLSFYPVYLSAFYFDQPSATATQIELVPKQGEQGLWTATDDDGNFLIANTGIAVGFASPEQYGEDDEDSIPPKVISITMSGGVGTLRYEESIETQSPAKRLYLYGEQVSFCFDDERQLLSRQVGDEDAVVLSNKLDSFEINVNGAGLNSNGVVHMELIFEDPRTSQNGEQGETSSYNHSVQVINVL